MSIEPFVYKEKRLYMKSRRCFNAAVALMALVVATPVLLVAGLAIVLEDGFPIVFSQRRVGRFERTFTMFKLRTMKKSDCGDDISPSHGSDPRITRVGRWLRRLSIDELPQFVNVLRGDMSLVGPRPEMPFIVNG
ncbi:MAG: sugar transferase, partial [Rhodanobacteraceae bacterium]